MENTIMFETMVKPQNHKAQTAIRLFAVPSLRVTCNFAQRAIQGHDVTP